MTMLDIKVNRDCKKSVLPAVVVAFGRYRVQAWFTPVSAGRLIDRRIAAWCRPVFPIQTSTISCLDKVAPQPLRLEACIENYAEAAVVRDLFARQRPAGQGRLQAGGLVVAGGSSGQPGHLTARLEPRAGSQGDRAHITN